MLYYFLLLITVHYLILHYVNVALLCFTILALHYLMLQCFYVALFNNALFDVLPF